MTSTKSLRVGFAGVEMDVEERLTFGRHADLQLDTDPHLHRVAGEFFAESGFWWLQNCGSRLFLNLVAAGGTRLRLSPGSRVALPPGSGVVSLHVGRSAFEIDYETPAIIASKHRPVESDGQETSPFDLLLTPREVDLLASFARPIMEATGLTLPTYGEVAQEWGISPKTVDNTIQGVKQKLKKARVTPSGSLEQMVQAVIDHSFLSATDIQWAFGGPGEPRKAADGPRFTDA